MSLTKPNNYSVADIDKSIMKPNVSYDQPPLTNSRKYNIKKISEVNKEHTNQNNTLYDNNRQFRHRSHASMDMIPKTRYKSYDYLPARRPTTDRYRNTHCSRREESNDFSDSVGDIHDDSHKFRKSYSYGSGKMYSSNEELDNSRNYEIEANPSTDSSRRYNYRPRPFIENHNDYHRSSRHTDYENRNYGTNDWNYETMNNYPEQRKYTRYAPSTSKFTKNPGGPKVKHGLRGTSYPSYLNNNRSDTSPRKLHNTQLTSDAHSMRYSDINNDNYSSHRKEVPNPNLLSLKSTYRKNENVPHSGTRLENHRKQLDKYCSGRSRETRFDESNNCDDSRRNNPISTNKSNKSFRTNNLPPSPKYSGARKKYGEMKNTVDDKYFNKEKFSTPRRSKILPRDQVSENESCYFENCHNTNNECTSRYRHGIKDLDKDNCGSVSEELSSSILVQSQEKPTDSVPISISTPKLNSSLKGLHSSFNRSNNFGDHFKLNSTQAPKGIHRNEQTPRCHHSQKSSRRRNSNKHH